MLPGGSGLRLLEELKRRRSPAAVIIISARDSLDDKRLRNGDFYETKKMVSGYDDGNYVLHSTFSGRKHTHTGGIDKAGSAKYTDNIQRTGSAKYTISFPIKGCKKY